MAPRTNGRLARGVAHDGHIHHENYEFTDIESPAPVTAFSCSSDLRFGSLDPAVCGGQTLGTDPGGCILEFTCKGGQHSLSPPPADKLTERPTAASSKSLPRWEGQHLLTLKIMIKSPTPETLSAWATVGRLTEWFLRAVPRYSS